MRELVYYAAVSIDGYIAGPTGQFDAFLAEGDHMNAMLARFPDAAPTIAAEALGITQTATSFDTVLMGWNTYAVGLPYGMTSPYRHLRQIVFSGSRTAEGEGVTTTAENPVEVVRALKADSGAGIWLCGGGALAAALVDEIDRLVLKVNPVLLGDGIPMFAPGAYDARWFAPVETTAYDSGVVVAEYRRRTS